jgi:hypothetical protein
MEKKDYFSGQSQVYAAFRPTYPVALYKFIFTHLKDKSSAWDCATGNGQVARYLADHFKIVQATDTSKEQLKSAFPAKNIFYSVSSAEETSFSENQFDLITVAQALHWFQVDQFYSEVRRTSKPGALLAVWGYSLLTISPSIDELFLDFYENTVGPYWDEARRLVENEYRDIPFPFEQISVPSFTIETKWTLDQLSGYLTSWSATQKYIQLHGSNPVNKFKENLGKRWPSKEVKPVTFPLFARLGKVNN